MTQSDVAGRAAMVYRAPNVDLRQYTRFIVDPVDIYRGGDADYGSTSEQEIQQMARFMHNEMMRVLEPRMTTVPGPNVAPLKLTLAELEGNTPVVATATRLAPAGLVANVVQQARGAPGSFTGAVIFAGELSDSQAGTSLILGI